jgi:ferredoxin
MGQLVGPTDPATDARWSDPKPRKGFFTDTSICIGCKACEVACKEWNRNPRGTRISAVLFGNILRAWRVTSDLPELWMNPWATNPLTQLSPFATVAVDGGNFVRSSATKTAEEVFGLPPDWPNSQPG